MRASSNPRSDRYRMALLLWVGAIFSIISCGKGAHAQVYAPGLDVLSQNNYPNQQYFVALEIYREGDLATAAEAFEDALGQCRKDVNGRWIDAIPVHAMLGECLYQAGDLPAAVEQIDAAMALAIRNRGWLSALEWQDALTAGVRPADQAAAWAAPNIPNLVPVSNRLKLGSGVIDATQVLQRGGVFESARLTAVDAVEIMRGLAIASYRRRVIFGPLSNQTDIANQVLEATKYPSELALPVPRALIGALRGCERFAGGQDDETLTDAGKAAVVGGGVHPLTPIVLLAAARSTSQREEFGQAIPLAMQAAAAASALYQPEWVGEAMMIAAGCVDQKGAGALMKTASSAAAAHLRRGRLASAGSLLASAESALLVGEVSAAQVALSQASALFQRRDMTQPRLAAHGEYLTAVAAAQSGAVFGLGEPSAIDAALSRMFTFTSGNGPSLTRAGAAKRRAGMATPSTPRLYQLGLVTAGARSRGVGGKAVDEIINQYAGDPPANVWRADPVDAIAYQVFDRSPSIAAQVVSAVKRDAPEELLVLIDALHRQRFLATQSLGGRVLQARRLAATDKTLLPEKAAAAMLKSPPAMLQMMDLLATPPPLPGTPELAQRGQRLESLAAQLALQRGEIPAAAPPVIAGVSDLEKLPNGYGLLTYVDVGGPVIAALATQGKIKTWNLPSSKAIHADTLKLLREIGVTANRAASRLEGENKWKQEAATLRRKLIPDEFLGDIESLTDLIVVPDGALWYLPMELLPLGDENTPLLGEKLAVRYSPTPALAIHPVAFSNFERPIGLVTQLFFAPRDGEANEQLINQITESLKAFSKLPANPPVPGSLLGESIGALAVLGVVTPNPANPFAFSPAIYDASDSLGSLGAWLRFPSRVPATVYLAGYRTAAVGNALGDGRELFLTLTGLHCSGVRDIVVSRWPVGGESTAILTKEFLQELPFEGVPQAWRRAVQSLRQSPLRPAGEPLLNAKDQERLELTGDHPLFWAGYLVDSPPIEAAK
ncbi:MAG: CHAT domain-containing protein [Planctomycetaceae bacterium]